MARIKHLEPGNWISGYLVAWEAGRAVVAVADHPHENPANVERAGKRYLQKRRTKRIREYKEDPLRQAGELDNVDGL